MPKINKNLISLASLVIIVGLVWAFSGQEKQPLIAYGAPIQSVQRNLIPETDSTYYVGTTTPSTIAWKGVITDELCLTGDSCKTAWPSTGASFAWTPTSYGVSTSTTIGFLNGFLSTASSTLTSSLTLSSLSNGGLGVNNGLVYSGATTTAGTGLTYSGNAFNVNTSQNITTLSNLTSNGFVKTSGGNGTLSVDTTTYSTFGYLFPSNATSTLIDFSGSIKIGTLAGLIGGNSGNLYAVSTTSMNASITGNAGTVTNGVYTTDSGTVTNTMLANSTISGIALGSNLANLTATDATLTFSGTYNGGTARTIGLNLGNTNTWTGGQIFGNATSTSATTTNLALIGTLNCIATGALTTDANGRVYCASITSGASFPFSATTNYGASAVSTSTPVWFTAGMMASTTANYFAGLTIDSGTPQDSWMTMGTTSHEWSLGYKLSDQSFRISSSTTLGTSDALTINKTTLKTTLASLDVDDLTSALVLTGAGGDFAEYTGADCTNQFIRDLSALGAPTCATVGASDVSLANLSATDSTLTFSGTYTGATARTIGLNLANPNTWTGGQTFGNSTTTATMAIPVGASVITPIAGNFAIDTTSGQLRYSDVTGTTRVLVPYYPMGFTFSSSTPGTGTTTRYLTPARSALTVTKVRCESNTFYDVSLYDGTNRANLVRASSTIGTFTYSTNNTFTANESMRVDVGTTTAPSGTAYLSCGFDYDYTSD